MLPSHWSLLGFVVWTLVLLITGIGAPRVMAVVRKQAAANSFNPNVPHGTERYQRTMRAHLNCVENLPVFAALVLLGSVLHADGWLFQLTAGVVLPARVGQSIAHVASGRNRAVLIRFSFFCVQLACFATMAALLAARGLSAR